MMVNRIKTAYHQTKWALVLRGAVSLTVGILIMTRPLASVAALALVIAFWALTDGFVNVMRAFQLRDSVAHWWALLVGGIVSAAFGAAALYYYPALSLSFAVIWTAFWLITSGVIAIYASVQERRVELAWGWTMAFGVVAIAEGVLAFVFPGVTLASLLTVLAVFGIIGGVSLLLGAVKMESFEHGVKRVVATP